MCASVIQQSIFIFSTLGWFLVWSSTVTWQCCRWNVFWVILSVNYSTRCRLQQQLVLSIYWRILRRITEVIFKKAASTLHRQTVTAVITYCNKNGYIWDKAWKRTNGVHKYIYRYMTIAWYPWKKYLLQVLNSVSDVITILLRALNFNSEIFLNCNHSLILNLSWKESDTHFWECTHQKRSSQFSKDFHQVSKTRRLRGSFCRVANITQYCSCIFYTKAHVF